jgi:hypothetical protein
MRRTLTGLKRVVELGPRVALGGYAAALTLGYVMGRFQRPAAGSPSGTTTGWEARADRWRFCSVQKYGKSSGPKAQPFIHRRAKPWYGPSQKICNVGQVANLPKTRQIGNLPHVGMLHIYCDGPYIGRTAVLYSAV